MPYWALNQHITSTKSLTIKKRKKKNQVVKPLMPEVVIYVTSPVIDSKIRHSPLSLLARAQQNTSAFHNKAPNMNTKPSRIIRLCFTKKATVA